MTTEIRLAFWNHGVDGDQFLLAVDTVPISIGMGWGVIIYSAMLFTDHSTLPPFSRPIADALLALHIDLGMDAVAIRWGMWDWGKGLGHDYYGVPYENFWAWFWVVFFFSASFRLLHSRPRLRPLAPLGAVVFGVSGVLLTNRLIVSYVPEKHTPIVIGLVLLFALICTLWQKPRLPASDNLPAVTAAVPLAFHLFVLCIGLSIGAFAGHYLLFAVGSLMVLISLYLHRQWLSALFNRYFFKAH